jgi:hypothetical protein
VVATVASPPGRPAFPKQLFGYNRTDVDRFVVETQTATNALKQFVGTANERAPFERVGTEVASVLRSLADSVAAVQQDAEQAAATVLAQAEAEATEVRERALLEAADLRARAEEATHAAERARAEAQEHARTVVAQAEARVGEMLRAQQTAADTRLLALDTYRRRAEDGLQTVLDQIVGALNDIRRLGHLTVTIDETAGAPMAETAGGPPAPDGATAGPAAADGVASASPSSTATGDVARQLDAFTRVLARLGDTSG